MKRLALLTAILCMGALATTPAAASGSSCTTASIAKPTLPGLIGVYDHMAGNCTSSLPGGYTMVLNMQYEQGGTWHPDQPSVYLAAISNGTSATLDNTWADLTPNCAFNMRGKGQWTDSTGGVIVSLFSLTLHKTC